VTRPLLILRPQPGANETATRAQALGLEPVVAPLFTIRPLSWEAPDPAAFDAVLLTSANAPRCAGTALSGFTPLPCWTVGAATAAAARAAGFADVHTGPADGAALAEAVAAAGVERALHLHGREHRPLSHPGLHVEGRAVYTSEGVTELPHAARALREPVALIHSPRAAGLFASMVSDKSAVSLAAISHAAADAAGGGWAEIRVAPEPRDDALLEVAAKLCHNPKARKAGAGGADGL
jgi:uroporphyrinogen-III synthase